MTCKSDGIYSLEIAYFCMRIGLLYLWSVAGTPWFGPCVNLILTCFVFFILFSIHEIVLTLFRILFVYFVLYFYLDNSESKTDTFGSSDSSHLAFSPYAHI